MKKLINFFLVKSKDEPYLIRKKAEALLFFLLASFTFILVYIFVFIFLINKEYTINSIRVPLAVLSVGALNILSLRFLKFKHSGNIFAISILLTDILAVYLWKSSGESFIPFISSFFIFLMLFIMGSVFVSRKVLFINTIITLGGVLLIFITYGNNIDDETKKTIFNCIASIIGACLSIFFILHITSKAQKNEKKSSKLIYIQNQNLNNLLKIIQESSINQEQLSDDINKSTDTLSSGSINQASNILEISSTIEKITQSIQNNSADIDKTERFINNTLNLAKQTEQEIQKSILAVKKINSNIGVIEDIAKETSILALNAAVEASKAGSAGSGFTVIAKEVQKLAENTQTASLKILDLIEDSDKVTEVAKEYLKNITLEIQTATVTMKEISQTAKYQKSSVNHIYNSVSAVNTAAQNNATISRKLKKAVNVLSENTFKLNQLLLENTTKKSKD